MNILLYLGNNLIFRVEINGDINIRRFRRRSPEMRAEEKSERYILSSLKVSF
jgi:hypothetical protein